jgi:hypothetical protein
MYLQSCVVHNQWKSTDVFNINKNYCRNTRLSKYNYMIQIKCVPVWGVN